MNIPSILYDLVKEFGIIAITFTAGVMVGWFRRKINYYSFLKVFGEAACKSDNLFICLPLWKINEARRGARRFVKVGVDGKTYSYYGPSEILAHKDVEASHEISTLFSQFFRNSVEIVFDAKPLNINQKSGIFIGSPIANIQVKSLIAAMQRPFIRIITQKESEKHPAAIAFLDDTEDTLFDSSDDREYSVIIRTKNPKCSSGYFFIICGAHAEGTFAAANYLRNNWKFFKKSKLSSAVVLLEMPRGTPDLAQVVRTYGFLKSDLARKSKKS